MSQPKQRQPRELLTSIHAILVHDYCYASAPMMPYRNAIRDASHDVAHLLNKMRPGPPKRSYYGSKGSLSNPFR